jgi:hypothetical protein
MSCDLACKRLLLSESEKMAKEGLRNEQAERYTPVAGHVKSSRRFPLALRLCRLEYAAREFE